ncbi:MAG TPA: helix-turn-helix domain-containing protein [Luteimonas sp.]|nr:helix-turn-helix domain-containing protein [Luteimonas sp.]HRO25990.1 helix-turn-helix domain-containing protein [Luteimonas sp.]HRP71236.1 helix-turn-helix domain-containing protein [Luteimonas sp.]
MGLVFVTPPEPLSSLVEAIWDCDLPCQAHAFDRLLPSARPQLVINLAQDETRVYDDQLRCTRNAGAALDGPSHRSVLIDTAEQTRVLGIVFRAGGAAAFFRERMDVIANAHVDLDALATGDARTLRQRLLETGDAHARLRIVERWLRGHADATGALRHPAIAHALQLIDAAPGVQRIDAIAAHCRMSPRRFGELFREQVGMSPKRYARLQRFHGVVAQVHRHARVDWAGIAVDGGFHDQAHLVHEFRAFSGMTPTAYLARQGEWSTHVPQA